MATDSVFRPKVRRAHVLELDPDLGMHIPAESYAMAAGRAVADLERFPSIGPWEFDFESIDTDGHLGLLIVEGILARRVTVGHRSGLELLGSGDVLRPWVRSEFAFTDVNWSVIEPLTILSLDCTFAQRVAPWPQITANISDRILLRARSLAIQVAVCHLVTVEERLLALLWHYAERWGRVTPEGVVMRLELTHELLAATVGARRPPVTTALSALARKGLVVRLGDHTWRLSGPPPASFTELHHQLGSPLEE